MFKLIFYSLFWFYITINLLIKKNCSTLILRPCGTSAALCITQICSFRFTNNWYSDWGEALPSTDGFGIFIVSVFEFGSKITTSPFRYKKIICCEGCKLERYAIKAKKLWCNDANITFIRYISSGSVKSATSTVSLQA